MIIDLDKYSINRKFIQETYANNRSRYRNIGEAISLFASSTHCPYICLALYLGETEGFTPELIRTIDTQISYYGYTEIHGQLPGSPYSHMDKK